MKIKEECDNRESFSSISDTHNIDMYRVQTNILETQEFTVRYLYIRFSSTPPFFLKSLKL